MPPITAAKDSVSCICRGVGKFREQVDPDEAFEKEDFPEDVWNEAKARLEQMPEEEREAMKEILGELGRNAIQQAGAGGVFEVFVGGLFRPSNFLWFFLAGVTAFRLGAGLQSEN